MDWQENRFVRIQDRLSFAFQVLSDFSLETALASHSLEETFATVSIDQSRFFDGFVEAFIAVTVVAIVALRPQYLGDLLVENENI